MACVSGQCESVPPTLSCTVFRPGACPLGTGLCLPRSRQRGTCSSGPSLLCSQSSYVRWVRTPGRQAGVLVCGAGWGALVTRKDS